MAIGELADGLRVELDKVPKRNMQVSTEQKLQFRNQERMAVVVDQKM